MTDNGYFSSYQNHTLEKVKTSNTIKFLKTRDVKSPSRANKYDAGIDFFVPEFTPEYLKILEEKNPEIWIDNDKIALNSGERILMPSGIYCQMANPYRALIAANKSGVSTKLGLIFGAQVVDYEYQGEIHLSLINTSDGPVIITPGMKILQFIETPIFCSELEVISDLDPSEFYKEETTRKDKGFGAHDKK
jgi:dUTPase